MKPAIYQTGSIKGEDILNYFRKLGTKVHAAWAGDLKNTFYFADCDNEITVRSTLPPGYELVSLTDVYPKEMYVSDDSDGSAICGRVKRLVWGRFKTATGELFYVCERDDHDGFISYKYAVDIPIQKPLVEITLEEVAKLKGVHVSQIRIKDGK